MKKIFFNLVIISFIARMGYGQQQQQYSLYMFNPLAVNPAYAGSNDAFIITGLYRNQWTGFDGAPQTQSITLHTPLKRENIGVGFSVFNDKIGATNMTGINADFSYKIKVNSNYRLAFGLKGGTNIFNSNYTAVEAFDNTEDIYVTANRNVLIPNFGFGLYYYNATTYIGLSSPKLIENKTAVISSLEKRHYFLTVGKVFKVNSLLDFKPSVLIKYTNNAPITYDLDASLLFMDKFWLGAFYRSNDAVGVTFAYFITNKIKLGYAYDYGISQLANYHSGSHEVLLSFDLYSQSKNVISPRYF